MTYQQTDLPEDMRPEDVSEKIITSSKHLISENNEIVILGILRGDSNKEKAKAVNKLLKDRCTEENMHFICHCKINVKQHLNRSNIHLNDHSISALISKNYLNNFESVCLQNKHNLFTVSHGSLSSEHSESSFSINNNILFENKELAML